MSYGRWIKKIPIVGGEYLPVTETNFRWMLAHTAPYWHAEHKIPVEQIKVDVTLFDNPNKVSLEDVDNILRHFDIACWLPIFVNRDYYLLDGQHRMIIAQILGLKFLDVIVQDTELANRLTRNQCQEINPCETHCEQADIMKLLLERF